MTFLATCLHTIWPPHIARESRALAKVTRANKGFHRRMIPVTTWTSPYTIHRRTSRGVHSYSYCDRSVSFLQKRICKVNREIYETMFEALL